MDSRGIGVREIVIFMAILLVTIMLAGILNPHLHYFANTMDNASDETDNPAPQSIFDNLNLSITLVPIIIVVLFCIWLVVSILNREYEYQTFSRYIQGVMLDYGCCT